MRWILSIGAITCYILIKVKSVLIAKLMRNFLILLLCLGLIPSSGYADGLADAFGQVYQEIIKSQIEAKARAVKAQKNADRFEANAQHWREAAKGELSAEDFQKAELERADYWSSPENSGVWDPLNDVEKPEEFSEEDLTVAEGDSTMTRLQKGANKLRQDRLKDEQKADVWSNLENYWRREAEYWRKASGQPDTVEKDFDEFEEYDEYDDWGDEEDSEETQPDESSKKKPEKTKEPDMFDAVDGVDGAFNAFRGSGWHQPDTRSIAIDMPHAHGPAYHDSGSEYNSSGQD